MTSRLCSGCGLTLPTEKFSQSQLKKGLLGCRCISCVEINNEPRTVTTATKEIATSPILPHQPLYHSTASGPTASGPSGVGPSTVNFAYAPPNFVMVPVNMVNDFQHLVRENEHLKQQVMLASETHATLRLELLEKVATIHELEKQNELLRKELADMKASVNQLQVNLAVDGFVLAIQDLNRCDSLETKIPSLSTLLRSFRNDRNSGAHYLEDSLPLSDININYRKMVLRDKLDSLASEVYEELDDQWPGLITQIRTYLATQPLDGLAASVTVECSNRTARWWKRKTL